MTVSNDRFSGQKVSFFSCGRAENLFGNWHFNELLVSSDAVHILDSNQIITHNVMVRSL